MILRQERTFLLSALLRSDAGAYVQLLPILSERGLEPADFPTVNGVALTSASAVETGLAAAAAAQASSMDADTEGARLRIVPE